ncbi:MAG: FkbM family methyltransferase [Symploca sp. SIO3C6]|uniref:FkbM family methyltransferase n=1 Tax=Symploca sp. SIO1C4 TaxID=2607765 RepID=A0A6B3NAR3_9CYAN|nr:FkbM family methyltransferase [Symploca sp. SIO3C6]NER26731.1 FkbM family methyltransferase [Symploca sp. SIO1C4]
MKTKEFLLNLCPEQLIVPLRFHYWQLRGKLESEIQLLKELVGKGQRAIDIGANLGVYTYALSQLCEVVEAFEPQPRCAETLLAYSQHSSNKINVHNVALSESQGLLTLHVPIIKGKPISGLASFRKLDCAQKSITVPVCRLDDYNFENISFIKIDVEGHESKVIKGGRNTILREKPILLVEIEQRHLGSKPMAALFEEITELGYEGKFLYKGQLIPLSEFSYEKYQKPFLVGVYHKLFVKNIDKNYANNFIFSPI